MELSNGEGLVIKNILIGALIGLACGAGVSSDILAHIFSDNILGRILIGVGMGHYSLPPLPIMAVTTIIGAVIGVGFWWDEIRVGKGRK